jgi:hypothetical protein
MRPDAMTGASGAGRAVSLCIAAVALAGVVAGARLAVETVDAERARVVHVKALAAGAQRHPQGEAASGAPEAVVTEPRSSRAGVADARMAFVEPRARAQRLSQFANVLAVRPTAGALWIAYAEEAYWLGDRADAIKAFDMSVLTARREAACMFARILFVLRAWPDIPRDRRDAVLALLAELRRRLSEREIAMMAAIVKEQPRTVRDEIADVFARLPGGDQHLLARMAAARVKRGE